MHFRNLFHRGRPRHNWDEMAAISSIDFDEDVKPDRPDGGGASSRGQQPGPAQPGCAGREQRGVDALTRHFYSVSDVLRHFKLRQWCF